MFIFEGFGLLTVAGLGAGVLLRLLVVFTTIYSKAITDFLCGMLFEEKDPRYGNSWTLTRAVLVIGVVLTAQSALVGFVYLRVVGPHTIHIEQAAHTYRVGEYLARYVALVPAMLLMWYNLRVWLRHYHHLKQQEGAF